ncbi:maleylacetoacetate isomerase [Shewanella litorisediminis]|uniref:Maleylacetoacetate isomerase n=1 Tax=Shewanella litorisediminis TaxID=1173586 RepID=A0ABX7FZM9_9GAMM|nr:maleylacetoacetate isomerase [Shewanella litorisediminis]MCL2919602.1 maleylacetoacetate isomerase [Shewanella litorisediminis]QRH00494.1 maleylacetoacetate isomerase [Shewanella litorisediminis]
MKLYGYWRSSAAYRVRIALNLKGLDAEQLSVHLVKNGGEQHCDDYVALNPQHLVPSLVLDDGSVLTQSLAIMEYFEDTGMGLPLLPASAADRATVRAMCLAIACEIHPLNNLRVLQYLSGDMGLSDEVKNAWYHHWIHEGFTAFEKLLARHSGEYCFGDTPTLADACLIPQVYNARRFNVPLDNYPNILRIEAHCNATQAFIDALPENQPDAQ